MGPTLIFDGGLGNSPPIEVVNGLFQVELDLGVNAFNGDARWLQIDVCCSSPCTPAFSTLVPRQAITATPYAIHTRGLFVDDTGNIGIGTTDPRVDVEIAPLGENADLQLRAGVAGARLTTGWNLAAHGADGSFRIGQHNGSVFTDWLTIDSNGRVGIRKTNPGVPLDVAGRIQADGLIESTFQGFKFPDATIQTTAANTDGHSLDAADGDPVDALFVDNSGNVGIGTTTPSFGNRLHVVADGARAIFAENSHIEGRGLHAVHTAATGTVPSVLGETFSSSDFAVAMEGVVTSTSSGLFSVGVRGTNNGTDAIGIGVHGSHAGRGRGVFGTSVTGTGVFGEHTSSVGDEPGIYGQTASTSLSATGVVGVVVSTVAGNSAAGVRGRNLGTGGTLGFGVHGSHGGAGQGVFGKSFAGVGVFGEHTSAVGTEPGVYGQTLSSASGAVGVKGEVNGGTPGPLSAGVHGNNSGTGSDGVGVYGSHAGSGWGVYGTSIAGTGVRGESNSQSGRGVFGWATAATGNTVGVWGQSNSSTFGQGVFGHASAGSGVTVGVEGQSNSTGGKGVRGWALASSGTTYGVWGGGGSPDCTGVLGLHDASSGTAPGVRGETDSTSANAVGVHGRINSTSPGAFSAAVRGENLGTSLAGIGVWGSQNGNGWGVLGQAVASTGGGIGVRGVSNSTSGFDFFADGAGANYGASSSIRWKSNVRKIDKPLSKIARLRGVYFDWNKDHGGHHDLGMIAEEVGKVLPEIVTYEENGIDAIGLDYSKLTPLLVEAVNALRAEKDTEIASLRTEKDAQIEALRKENTAIVARLQAMESMLGELAGREIGGTR